MLQYKDSKWGNENAMERGGGGRKLIASWLSREAAVRQCVQSTSPVQNTTRHLCTEHPSTSIRFLI